jgi:hypothetical protein
MLQDGAAVDIQEVFGRRIVVPSNGNLAFAQSVVEQLASGDDLISLRSRASAFRPLTVVRQMEADAQKEYFGKIQSIETELQKTTEKLQDLQKARGAGAKSAQILTPQQQEEIERFRKRVAETRKELKELRKNLRQDAEQLVLWTKIANIALMPLLVALAGLAVALVRPAPASRGMNARVAAVLVALLVLFGGGALYYLQQARTQKPAGAAALGKPLLKGLKVADIASIQIREPQETLTLERKDAGWTIAERAGFPADLERVREFLVKAIELKVGQAEPIGPPIASASSSTTPQRASNFAAPTQSARRVARRPQILQGRARESRQGDRRRRFVLLPAEEKTVYIVSDPLAQASAKSADWILRTGFSAEKVQVARVRAGEGRRLEDRARNRGCRVDVRRSKDGRQGGSDQGKLRGLLARERGSCGRPRQGCKAGRNGSRDAERADGAHVRRPYVHAARRQPEGRELLRERGDRRRAQAARQGRRRAREEARRAAAARALARGLHRAGSEIQDRGCAEAARRAHCKKEEAKDEAPKKDAPKKDAAKKDTKAKKK